MAKLMQIALSSSVKKLSSYKYAGADTMKLSLSTWMHGFSLLYTAIETSDRDQMELSRCLSFCL